jgi:hypothetical protein
VGKVQGRKGKEREVALHPGYRHSAITLKSWRRCLGVLLVLPRCPCVSLMCDTLERSSWQRAGMKEFQILKACKLGATCSSFYSTALLCLLAAGVCSFFGPFWALPSEFLTGFSAAPGIALIDSFGNLGGLVGPHMIGANRNENREPVRRLGHS